MSPGAFTPRAAFRGGRPRHREPDRGAHSRTPAPAFSSASVTKAAHQRQQRVGDCAGRNHRRQGRDLSPPCPARCSRGRPLHSNGTPALAPQAFRLLVGSSVGGGQYHFSTTLDSDTRSHEANGLPVGDATVYVRLSTQIAGVWQHNDYTFMADDSPIEGGYHRARRRRRPCLAPP